MKKGREEVAEVLPPWVLIGPPPAAAASTTGSHCDDWLAVAIQWRNE